MGDLVDTIEEALPVVLKPYLDKVEYGKLRITGCRKADNEINVPQCSIQWTLVYNIVIQNNGTIDMYLTPTNQFIIKDQTERKDNATLKDLMPFVLRIPERRRKEIEDYSKNYPDNLNFLGALISTCRRENCEPIDLYSKEELEFAKFKIISSLLLNLQLV